MAMVGVRGLWHGEHTRTYSVAARPPSAPAAASKPSIPAASNSPSAAAQGVSAPPDITDLPAKLALLETVGIGHETALRRYSPYLCSSAHHIAVRLAFLQSRGKLRHPPRLWQVICPSDAELCRLHGEDEAQLAAFKAEHLASPAWRDFCAVHSVEQTHPAAAAAAATALEQPTGEAGSRTA
ncbi:hypothetical protein ABPG77_009830 [Micractinium sp. CCAP 211/92]